MGNELQPGGELLGGLDEREADLAGFAGNGTAFCKADLGFDIGPMFVNQKFDTGGRLRLLRRLR